MLDLNEEDLAKLPSDRKVMKFMNGVKKVNENPEFFSYMTKEEDEEKCHNTELKEAINTGIDIGKNEGKIEEKMVVAKIMLKKHIPIKDIIEITELTNEEIEKLQKNEEI